MRTIYDQEWTRLLTSADGSCARGGTAGYNQVVAWQVVSTPKNIARVTWRYYCSVRAHRLDIWFGLKLEFPQQPQTDKSLSSIPKSTAVQPNS
jgi:hypothetical protein